MFHGHVLQRPHFELRLFAKGLALGFQLLGVGVVLLNGQIVFDRLFPGWQFFGSAKGRCRAFIAFFLFVKC